MIGSGSDKNDKYVKNGKNRQRLECWRVSEIVGKCQRMSVVTLTALVKFFTLGTWSPMKTCPLNLVVT